MRVDLYADLGVPPDAFPAEIARAWRSKVKGAHPDVGGDPENFRRLVTAKIILTDPVRRAKYDETGEIDEAADRRAQEVLNAIAQALSAALKLVLQGQADAGQVDILDQMRSHISANLAEGEQSRQEGVTVIARLEGTMGRFSVSDGTPNQIEALIAGQLADLQRRIVKLDGELAILKTALDTLKAYSYRVDRVAAFFPLGATAFYYSASTS
jgi:curved DNA-binding protein CbpA